MPLTLTGTNVQDWDVRHIAVIGPGIVGMPMAALLAHASLPDGPVVTVIQRDSPTSGWKVDAINAGRSPIGGVEPGLNRVVAEAVAGGRLRASHDPQAAREADVVLVCVQTDRDGDGPDYGPLLAALDGLTAALHRRPRGNVPVVVFESTLAPSSMATVIRERFQAAGLVEGRDVLLGNSPNRVMPGRLVDRVAGSDKIVGGLHPATPGLIASLYRRIVTRGTLHETNSLTAEVVKTLENAYRDVRIAYAAEVARYCDRHDIAFHPLREAVNEQLAMTDAASRDPGAIPTGGLLVPTVGVGGHCLPKDGILLYWRWREAGRPAGGSVILGAREVNTASPAYVIELAERHLGAIDGRQVTLLGAAYRPDADDTRNAPALALAGLLRRRGCAVRVHDPYVKPGDENLRRFDVSEVYTRDLEAALRGADLAVITAGHAVYTDQLPEAVAAARVAAVVDGCHLLPNEAFAGTQTRMIGIGRGSRGPEPALVTAVLDGFRAIEVGVANEVDAICRFLNARYANGTFGAVDLAEVRRLAASCPTGCAIVEPGPVAPARASAGFRSMLVDRSRTPAAGRHGPAETPAARV